MPELRLDLELLESNARRIATQIVSLGKQWRPHVKAHSQPKIARLLVELGANGITCATVGEAEVMAEAGIPSVLFAHIAVAEGDLNRLAAVASRTDLILTIDHFVQAEMYSRAAVRNDVSFRFLVDIDVGMNRTGCRPRIDATQLAQAADRLPGLTLAGIMGYEGHLLTVDDVEQKRTAIHEAMGTLEQTRDAMLAAGLTCEIVSAGASGSFWVTGEHNVVTELQAGGGIFGDPFYRIQCGLSDVQPALTVVADVVSRPALDRAVINAGRKSINPVVAMPHVVGTSGAVIQVMNAEHSVLSLEGDARDLKIGDRVRLVVGYSDHSILMHRKIQVYNGEHHIDVWPVVRRS